MKVVEYKLISVFSAGTLKQNQNKKHIDTVHT